MFCLLNLLLLGCSRCRHRRRILRSIYLRERSPPHIPGELRKVFRSPMVNKSVTLFDSRSSGSSVARYWHHCWSHCAFPDYLYGRKKGEKEKKRYESDFQLLTAILCFHSHGQHLCKFIGTKESVYIRKTWPPWRYVKTHNSPLQRIGPCAIWMSPTPEFYFCCSISVKMFKNSGNSSLSTLLTLFLKRLSKF